MKRPSETECITLVYKGGVVTFCWEDGATADVSRDVVANSTLLHSTLSDATPGDEVKLNLKRGTLQQWLHAVSDEPYLLKMLKAADFLGDDTCVQSLSSHAGLWLFEHSESCSIMKTRGRAVASLPNNLIERILDASTVGLEHQIMHLPEDLHVSAIQAAFPTIAKHGRMHCEEYFKGRSVCEGVGQLWPQLHKIPQLTSLSLQNMNLDVDDFEKYMQDLCGMTHLRRLNLQKSGLGGCDNHIATLLPVLAKLTSLEGLDISSVPITSTEAVHALATGMSHLAHLKHLRFTHVAMPLEGHQLVIPSMAQHMMSIEVLDLSSCGISQGSFVDHLTKMSTLRKLRLDSNSLTDDAIHRLGVDLSNLQSLEVLSLDSVFYDTFVRSAKSTASIIRDFAQHLSFCTGLRMLDLSWNGLEDVGLLALMQHLSHLTSLQRLYLAENLISDKGTQATMQYFKCLTNLRTLSIYDSERIGPSVETLMPLVSTLPSLKELFVSIEVLCDAGAHHVFKGPYSSSNVGDEQWADENL